MSAATRISTTAATKIPDGHQISSKSPKQAPSWACVGRDMEAEPRRALVKPNEDVMEILEAFDLTGTYRAAGRLAGCDPKTVENWVAKRDAGHELEATTRSRYHRPQPRQDRGVGRALQGRHPSRPRPRQAHRHGLRRVRAHHTARGRRPPRTPTSAATGASSGRGRPSRGCGSSGTGEPAPRTGDAPLSCGARGGIVNVSV